jgi:hypothetical protein
VFAAVPSYYFRGFGAPVDGTALNVTKAGRAIPIKWQLFDPTTAPVTSLDPKNVTVTSVLIDCTHSALPVDGVEEYATGGSGLPNLGDGSYQAQLGARMAVTAHARPPVRRAPNRRCSDLLAADPLPRRRSSRQVGTITTSEQSAIVLISGGEVMSPVAHRL